MKKQAGKGSKHAKPAGHTGDYTPGDVAHVPLSTSSADRLHPSTSKPDPQGGGYWGDTNGFGMGPALGPGA